MWAIPTPGAPGPPGPPRPGPHPWGEVPGAGLRRAQLCRASPLMDAFAGTTFFLPSPGEDLQGRAVLSSLRLTRPKLQGRGRPQSLDKTPHGIGKGSPARTQQAALVGGRELPSWLLSFLLVAGRGGGRKRLKAREAAPLFTACLSPLSAANLFCVHIRYTLSLQSCPSL